MASRGDVWAVEAGRQAGIWAGPSPSLRGGPMIEGERETEVTDRETDLHGPHAHTTLQQRMMHGRRHDVVALAVWAGRRQQRRREEEGDGDVPKSPSSRATRFLCLPFCLFTVCLRPAPSILVSRCCSCTPARHVGVHEQRDTARYGHHQACQDTRFYLLGLV